MHQEFTLLTEDQLELYGQYWAPEEPIRAVICLVHGMGEHSGRYAHVAEFFNRNGIAVVAMDHRGHGRSQGKKGHTPSYNHLLNDVGALLKTAENTFPGKPVFLYGHSMGANLVLNYAIRNNPVVKGIISTSAYLKLAFDPPAWKVKLGKLSAGILPGLTQATGLDTKAISRDPEEVKKYENDPLVHDKMSAAFFVNVHFAGPYAIEHAAELKIPTLIMHGTADKLTSAEGTKEFAGKSGPNVELKLWNGLYHEMQNEPEKEEVFKYTLNWINHQLNN
jgi:alpha-beta hydrolase superfamily lysophospholipase